MGDIADKIIAVWDGSKGGTCNCVQYARECGKEIILDNELIDQINVYQGRDITEENFENENPQVLEFMDMQISEQTFGKRLCSDCLQKYLKDKNLI